ncbi:MAG: agmatine deiminase family protein [Bacteroidales bacterium]|nr:agmatine deiminase family protein [Bacteroidales bacterium]
MEKLKKLLTSLLFCALGFVAFSQSEHYAQPAFPYHATAEEQQMLKTWYKNVKDGPAPTAPVTAIAEFQPMGGVMVSYPLGIPVNLVSELSFITKVKVLVYPASDSNTVKTYFAASGVNMDNVSFWVINHDSYWTRDYGPWFIIDGNDQVGVVDFTYNRPARPNDDAALVQVANLLQMQRYEMPMVHTGGNYMVDGYGTAASTTLLLEENPNQTSTSLQTMANQYLGINNYMLLDDPLGDYIEHIDCWGKFLDVDKVLIAKVPSSDPRYSDYEAVANTFANALTPWGNHYQVFRVNAPGRDNTTPFTNSLILNDHVFVPVAGTQYDNAAIAVYQQAMPGYTIVPIMQNNNRPWQNTDALHCRTHELADPEMLYIKHYPLLGEYDLPTATTIHAEIKALGGQSLVCDSLLVYYRVNGGTWQTTRLELVSGGGFEASLTGLQAGDEVDYYLFAQDQSGRRECHPYIGAADPHHFKVLTVGVEDVATSNAIAIYPNPCSRYFVVNCPKTAQSIEVFDITGSLVFSTRNCEDRVVVGTSDWKSGIYLVKIVDKSGNVHNRKVVKR